MIASELEKTFTRFLIVGFMLLLLEAIILFFLTSFFGIKPELGRVVSLSVSIILGWYANRSFTFRNRSRLLFRQFFKYYSSMLCGLVINCRLSLCIKFTNLWSSKYLPRIGVWSHSCTCVQLLAMKFLYLNKFLGHLLKINQ